VCRPESGKPGSEDLGGLHAGGLRFRDKPGGRELPLGAAEEAEERAEVAEA